MSTWSKIPGFHYSVSTSGEVRNDETDKIKQPTANSRGYSVVDLYRGDGSRKKMRVHRLVASAFIPNPDGKPEVNHKDGNKLNNSASNLEWVSASENMKHAWATGLEPPHASYGMRGHKNPNAGAKGRPVRCIETDEVFKNVAECERVTGIPDSCVFDNLAGRSSHAHHYHFEYA